MRQDAQQYERFKSLEWFGEAHTITIAGCGGIGSWAALFLTRIGHNLILLDNDTFEHVNLAGQFVATSSIGLNKADAVRNECRLMCGYDTRINTFNLRYTENCLGMLTPIVVSAFDNIESRKVLFNDWKKNPDRVMFIDGRLTSESGIVLACIKGNEEAYEKTLFSGQAEIIPCTAKATSHCGAIIASLMVSLINNHLANLKLGDDFREVPFHTNFYLPAMLFNTSEELDLVSAEKEQLAE